MAATTTVAYFVVHARRGFEGLQALLGEAIRGILPFLAILLIVLAIITYVPVLTLWLPDAIFGP